MIPGVLGEEVTNTYRIDDVLKLGKFQALQIFFLGLTVGAVDSIWLSLSVLQIAWKGYFGVEKEVMNNVNIFGFTGLLLGTSIWAAFCDRFGRFAGALAPYTLYLVGSTLLIWAPNIYIIFFGWFVLGVTAGGFWAVAFTILAEWLPAAKRGHLARAYAPISRVYITWGAVLGWLVLSKLGWRNYLMLQLIPLVLGFSMFLLVPESARWLLSQGRTEEAERALNKVCKMNSTPQPEGSLVSTGAQVTKRPSLWQSLKTVLKPQLRRTTVCLWGLWTSTVFVTYAFNFLGPLISKKKKVVTVEDIDWSAVILGNAGTIASSLLFCIIGDFVSRRLVLAVCWGLTTLGIIIMSFDFNHTVNTILFVGGRFTGDIQVGLVYLYTAECYPTNCRVMGVGMGSVIGRVAGYPSDAVTGLGIKYACYIMLGGCAVALVALFFIRVDTVGVELSDAIPGAPVEHNNGNTEENRAIESSNGDHHGHRNNDDNNDRMEKEGLLPPVNN